VEDAIDFRSRRTRSVDMVSAASLATLSAGSSTHRTWRMSSTGSCYSGWIAAFHCNQLR